MSPPLYLARRIAYRRAVSVVTLSQIEKILGHRSMFDKLDLNIEQGERLGLIGANGSGKTTLLRILTGQMETDGGTVAVSKGVRIGYLTQDPSFDEGNSVIDEAELAFSDLHTLAHRLRDIEHAMHDPKDEALEKLLDQYQKVQHDFELAGGYAWRHKLEATLLGVGLPPESWEQPVPTLSGGQKSRLALAKLLIADPDLLLLDEPTNHLDLAAIEWLENYLLGFNGAVLIISHDRYLLDRLATRIVWLTQGRLKSYTGNYSAFLQQKELEEISQRRAYEEQQADIEKQKEFIRRFGAGQRSKEAKGREKRLNRLLKSDQVIGEVQQSRAVALNLGTEQRAGDQVLQVREIEKGFDQKELWEIPKLDVRRGERIGIIGPNGSGKTTLLRVLLGEEAADKGTLRWGANLNIGYYDQRLGMDEFDPESTVIDEVLGDRQFNEQQLRDTLAMLLFRNEDVNKKMAVLSGGERARVRLAQLLLDRPNVLVMDEPTNHLDIATCEALEAALRTYPGTLLCVSHDRYFLDHVVGRLLVIEPPNVTDFAGRYSDWTRKLAQTAANAQQRKEEAAKQQAKAKAAETKAAATAARNNADRRAGNPYLRPFGRLTVSELEKQITETEVALAECQQSFSDPTIAKDPSAMKRTQAELNALTKKLKGLEEEFFSRET